MIQIMLGTVLLSISAVIHVGAVAFSIPIFPKVVEHLHLNERTQLRTVALLTLTVFVLVIAHTVQIWVWAVTFLYIADLPDLATSFYFATVTYTTLGYGDIVLGPDARIVATFCAIAGLLTFGISTAFLIGVLSKVMPAQFGERD